MSETQTPALPTTASLKPPRFQASRAISALILREMASTYGASPGGYIWAVLQPVGMLVLLAMGFSLLVRVPSLGTSFILFYASGYLPFDMYNTISGKIAGALKYSRSLLAYPRMSWVDAVLSRFILHVLTLTTVFCIVIAGIFLIVDVHVTFSVIPILQGLSMAALLGFGMGLINAVLSGLFPVWQTIWGIVSRPLVLASGVFFIYEDLPGAVQEILWWNPLFHVTGLVREGLYVTYEPAYVSMIYGYGVSLGLILFGLIFMRSNYARILES